MIISKLYNKTIKPSANNSDPRVITPSSIPIFILPPTIDTYSANGKKIELNGKHIKLYFHF